jgi:nucleoside phosphorylase
MRIDRPIFCFQINREIYKHLGIQIRPEEHRRDLRTSILSTLQPHYASHAQIIECFHTSPELVGELAELSRLQIFTSLSRQTSIGEFLDTRRRMYDWDRAAYPMYFESDLSAFKGFPTVSHSDPSTTVALREVYGSLYRNRPPNFENRLDIEERTLLQKSATAISKFVNEEDGALTAAYFKRLPDLTDSSRVQQVLSKILPVQFTGIYQDVFEALTATGIAHLASFEDLNSFPYVDVNIVLSLLIKLGLRNLVLDQSKEGTNAFISYRLHSNFPEFVRAKDMLLYILSKKERKSTLFESHELQTAVRSLPEMTVVGDAIRDPLAAASQIYRVTEHLCATDRAAATRKSEMPDALGWKGKYLIFTATDIEDAELHSTMKTRGFSDPVVENHSKFTCLTRFRADIGRVFHVRTSAGSGGASGAIIMGTNAIDDLRPQFVISVGICFGLDESKQRLGEIVVSEMIHDYEKKRVSQLRPEDRGPKREVGSTLLSRARAQRAIWDGASVHVGAVASGEKLVDDQEFREELKKLQPKPIAGDMEAWGLSAACHAAIVEFLMVKGICDWGFNKRKSKQKLAARNACEFTLKALVV